MVQVSTAGGQTTYPSFSCYHAAKWGIEGFCEAIAKEVAPFGLEIAIVEPGSTPTGFGAAFDIAPSMPEYDNTPAGALRQIIESGAFEPANDPDKVAAGIIETPARLRVPLGVDTFNDIRADYMSRLAEFDAQRERALSVAREAT